MKSLSLKLVSSAVGFMVLAATPALAKTVHSRVHTTSDPAYAAAPDAMRAFGDVRAFRSEPVVVPGGRIIGADPDPNIRLELLRDYPIN